MSGGPEAGTYEDQVIVVSDGSIVYAARRAEDVLRWVNDHEFERPVLVTALRREDESELMFAAVSSVSVPAPVFA
jgi:hypothetical protein